MKVYGITGLPGSGKSIISRIAKKENIYTISMGDVIRKEAELRNCSPGTAAVNLRKKYGNNVVADRCVKHIQTHAKNSRYRKKTQVKKIHNKNKNKAPRKYKKIEQDVYMIEGIRSPQEVKYFKKFFKNFKVIAIHSNPEARFNRLKRRKRSDHSAAYKDFLERDRRELKFGIGEVIALADYMLINEGPIQVFKNNVRALIVNEIKPKNQQQRKIKPKGKGKPKGKAKQNRKPKKGRKQYKKYEPRRPGNKQVKR